MNYRPIFRFLISGLLFLGILGCEYFTVGTGLGEETDSQINENPSSVIDTVVADHEMATQAVLRSIPEDAIADARRSLSIAYIHTSHGTHVSRGLFGLPGFQNGDADLFGITNNASSPDPDKLDFHDSVYNGSPYSDLSQADSGSWSTWRNQVRGYLDSHTDINVMMWSWCNIAGHDVTAYLASMETLISEYPDVTFIFMTGHANGGSGNLGDGNPENQAELITEHCKANNRFCIDYWSIDTHTMDGTFYEDTDDDANSSEYGGNFYQDYQNSHTEGVDWYDNLDAPGGSPAFGAHNTQHITANRKAYAAWYIFARIAGWGD